MLWPKHESFAVGKEYSSFGEKLRTERSQKENLVEHIPDPHYRCPTHTETLRNDKEMSTQTLLSAHVPY